MIKLTAASLFHNSRWPSRRLLRVTRQDDLPEDRRSQFALLSDGAHICEGYGAYLTFSGNMTGNSGEFFHLPDDLRYLSDGDVVRIHPNGLINVLFRKGSRDNTILLTYRCNHYCLMCSQPPRNQDDSWLLDDALKLLEMLPKDTINIGFSGGEPTTYGDGFIELIRKSKSELPNTTVDVLTNGRAFKDAVFVRKLEDVAHRSLVLGVPIYSDDPVRHDYVVQSSGAFDETIAGILNLKRHGQKVEIRIVIHKISVERLLETCEFICRNLLFVDHVALMGLEMMGFARANLEDLWIDPYDYKDTLSRAVATLNTYGLNTSVYNHQLCVINEDVYGSYKRSISDWKTEYIEECKRCRRQSDCGGLFFSSKLYRYSDHIKALS